MLINILRIALLALGVIMAALFWMSGTVTVGVIGYAVLFVGFVLSLIATIQAPKTSHGR